MKYFIWWQNLGITEVITRSYLENQESLIYFTLLDNAGSLIHFTFHKVYFTE